MTRGSLVEFQTVLKRRRMVRAFEQRPVPPEVLDPILRSVLHAPSAGFTQGNEFLVIDDPDRLDAFLAYHRYSRRARDQEERAVSAAHLDPPTGESAVLYGSLLSSRQDPLRPRQARSVARAVLGHRCRHGDAAILLSAVDAGLGAYFFGSPTANPRLRREFKIPGQFRPIGAIGLGFPASHDPWVARSSAARLARRPIEDLVHSNSW